MKNIAELLGSFTDFLYLCSVVEGRVKVIIIFNSQLKKAGFRPPGAVGLREFLIP